MNTEAKLYRNLQIHLDEQTIGFPSTESGSDIRLLKQLFDPEEAETATLLTYKYEALKQIHKRGEKIGKSIKEVDTPSLFLGIHKKGSWSKRGSV